MKTLIISDLHLGARNSMTSLLERFLLQPFDCLILNGDTIDSLNFKRFKPGHWRVIKLLRAIAVTDRLVLLRGNHDEQCKKGAPNDDLNILPKLLGVPFIDSYSITVTQHSRYLVLHGHQFDPTLSWPALTDAADWCYRTVQKINKRSAKWLKHQVKELGGIVELVRRGSARHAFAGGYCGVITGHTHYHEDSAVDGIRFLNCGSWVDTPCHYVSVENNVVSLRAYAEDTDDG